MADMEVLAPGGHQHLVDKIKEQLAMKADASVTSAIASGETIAIGTNVAATTVDAELASLE